MSAFWTILLAVIKWAAIIGGSFALVVLLIVVFHPLYFTLSGRASIKGQRGEIKFSYLFNIVRIRYIASIHTQDVWLEVFKWRKLLQRETVKKPEKPRTYEPTAVDDKPLAESHETAPESQETVSEKQETALESQESEIKLEESTPENITEKNLQSAVTNPETETESKESVETSDEAEPDSETQESAEKSENKDSIIETHELEAESQGSDSEKLNSDQETNEPEYKVEATPEQLAELQNILEAEEKKEEAKKSGNDWRAKMRKFKKDFNRRYDQLRGKIRLIRQKWKSLWPVVKRFWNRGKKGFRFHDASITVKYSLDEHHLTGLMCGYLAPTIGFAKKYGVNWEPVPVFPNKPGAGIYSKASWHIDIRPYMLVWAVLCLLFEKNLYKEIYWLYKFKKDKKAKKKDS